MTEWTAARLDALPEHVVIEYRRDGLVSIANRRDDYGWIDDEGGWLVSEDILDLADPGSIRVVSVPVDALLNPAPTKVPLGRIDPTSEGALMVLRAAIGHVTGEAP